MKNRRIAIVAFLLCACMVIGIGYAALSKELTVGGTAHAGARSDLEVWFVAAEKDDTVENNQCTVATLSADTGVTKALTVNMETANMQNVGDKAVAKFKIKNDETVANGVHAKVYDPTYAINGANASFTNPEDFYSITYEFVVAADNPTGEEHNVVIAQDKLSVTDLPPQYSVYLVVTVELVKSVINTETSHAANFTITYTAEAIEATH